MTNQEIFDTVVQHLRQQGRKATTWDGRCRYCINNGDKVLKCAAGALIPDSEYTTSIEGRIVHYNDYFLARFDLNQISLIKRLQEIHDYQGVSFWEDAFKLAADEFDLIYTPKTP